DDIPNMEQIMSLEGLTNFYNDPSTEEFKFTFQERKTPESDVYEWKESLLASAPQEYGQDRLVYVFMRSIEEMRMAEQNLNEFAHRLSYSLAMFDYAYSVDINTKDVDIIGGRMFDGEMFTADNISYQDITTTVKNSLISESDQAAFRRLSYIDELLAYFATHPALLTKSFRSLENEKNMVEVSIIYGAREQKLTFFVRRLDRSVFMGDSSDSI
ncbi:MAG: hypothetical protein II742_05180, partial [Clostridia bacterium]|nr:hypothetical protein [Clostridia bacterium]